MRRTAVGLGLLVAALAATATWQARRDPPPAAPASPPPASAGRPAPPVPAPVPPKDAVSGPGPVRGRVLRDGQPVAARVDAFLLEESDRAVAPGADVHLAWLMAPRLRKGAGVEARATTEAGADGRWSLAGLSAGEWLLMATAGDGAQGAATHLQWSPDVVADPAPESREDELEIRIRPAGGPLRGRAQLPTGEPFRGLILAVEERRPVAPPVKAGPAGEFRFPWLPRACVHLVACEPGRRLVPGPFVLLPCEEDVTFVVGAGLDGISGRVIDAASGAAVPEAVVTASSSDGEERAIADAQGRYELAVPFADWIRMRADAPGFLPDRKEGGEVTGRGEASIDFRLSRPAILSGTVRQDGSGSPATGAIVCVLPSNRLDREAGDPRATAGPDGRYEIRGLRPGRRMVLVVGGGYLSKSIAGPEPWDPRADTVDLPDGGATTRELLVASSPRVRGRVLDAAGKGLEGVEVALEPEWSQSFETRPSDALLPESFITDAEGRFLGPTLLPGVGCRLLARRRGETCAVEDIPAIRPRQEAEVVLRVHEEVRLEVRVVEEGTDRPLPGIRVGVMAGYRPGSYWGMGADWRTGGDGCVSVGPVPRIPLLLRAIRGGDGWEPGGEESGEIRVEPPAAGPLVLRLGPEEESPTLSVSGRILLPDGTPAANVGWHLWGGDRPGLGMRTGNADFRGRFQIEGLAPGPVSISACAPGEREACSVTAVAGDRGVVLHLRAQRGPDGTPRPGLRLLVRDASGRPVRGGAASIRFPDARERRSLSETYAEAVLAGGEAKFVFPPGATQAWVQVSGASGSGPDGGPLADALIGPLLPTQAEFEAALVPAMTIEGRVVDPEGKPVEGASVEFSPRYEGGPERTYWTASTVPANADGTFRFERAGDREYELSAWADGDFWGSEEPTARGGESGVVVRMRRAASALITVLDAHGRPVEGASVHCEVPSFHTREEVPTTNASGKVLLPRLSPGGGYRLTIRPPEGRADLRPVQEDDWVPKDAIYRLATARPLVVRVLDPRGRPVPSVHIYARFGNHRSDLSCTAAGETGVEGTVTLEGMAAGPVEIQAWLGELDWQRTPAATAQVEGHAGQATLTLDPGESLRVRVPGSRAGDLSLLVGAPGDPQPLCRIDAGPEPVTVRGLRAGVPYDVFVVEGTDGTARSGLLRGVRPGQTIQDVTIAPGREIRGVVHLPEGWRLSRVGVLVGQTMLIPESDSNYEDGTFRIGGVPEGRWTVRALLWRDGEEHYRVVEGEAEGGGSVEMDGR